MLSSTIKIENRNIPVKQVKINFRWAYFFWAGRFGRIINRSTRWVV